MNEGKIKHITPLIRGFYDNGESQRRNENEDKKKGISSFGWAENDLHS